MSEDLHDIDDLFRNGIEGHEEDVPPSVWEGVNNDLDKKQASYYKSKYFRLKRAALALFLLCLLGGTYIVYREASGKKESATAKQTNAPSVQQEQGSSSHNQQMVPSHSSAAPSVETGNEPSAQSTSPNVTSSSPVDSTAAKAESIAPSLENKTTVEKGSSTVSITVNDETKKNKNNSRKNLMTKDVVANQPSTSVQQLRNASNPQRTTASTKLTDVAKAGDKPMRNETFLPKKNTDVVTSSTASGKTPLNGKNFATPVISFKALTANDRTILPQPTTVAKSQSSLAHRFSLSVFGSPNVSFDRLEDDDHLAGPGPGRNRQEAHRQEEKNVSFSAGVLVDYNISKKVSIQSGVSVTSSTTIIAPSALVAKADGNGRPRFEFNCSSGVAYITPSKTTQVAVGDTVKTSGTVTKLTYVTVPVAAVYHVSAGRFTFSPTVGAGVNILASGKTKTSLSSSTNSENTTANITGLKSTYVDGRIGLGVDYRLSKTLSVGVRPVARIALTPINQQTPVRSYQNALNVETGLRIKL